MKEKLIIENFGGLDYAEFELRDINILICDFLLLIKELECFIELKGQNINEAVKQIEATIKKLSGDQKKQKKKSYIICTRSPMTSKKIQNLRVLFRKRYNSDLIIKSTPYEDSL